MRPAPAQGFEKPISQSPAYQQPAYNRPAQSAPAAPTSSQPAPNSDPFGAEEEDIPF